MKYNVGQNPFKAKKGEITCDSCLHFENCKELNQGSDRMLKGCRVCKSYEQSLKDFINKIDLTKAEKIAVVVFNDDVTTECGYYNMELRDKALAKHELEIDIVDSIIKVNKDRYFEK